MIIHKLCHRVVGQKEELHPFHHTSLYLFLYHPHQIYQFPVVTKFNMVLFKPNPMSIVHPYKSIFRAINSLLGHG